MIVWGELARREAIFNPTISRLIIFKLMLFTDKKTHPEEFILRGESCRCCLLILRKYRCVFCEVFVAISVGDGEVGIAVRKVSRSSLTVDYIVRSSDHIEVTHLMDKRTCL